jgi:hypothetical protein
MTRNPKALPIEYWTLSSLKIIKKTNSNNQIQQSHWPPLIVSKIIIKKISHTYPTLLHIEWLIHSKYVFEKKFEINKSSNVIAHNIFLTNPCTSLFNTLYILVHKYNDHCLYTNKVKTLQGSHGSPYLST